MKTQHIFFVLPVFILAACVTDGQGGKWMENAASILNASGYGQSASELSAAQIAAGLKEALNVGTGTVASQLGKSGGFNTDPKIRIPLPDSLRRVDDALKVVGMNSLTEDLQNRMNAAAESAMPRAKELFFNAIAQMTIDDARSILSGQQDAATQYLRRTMGAALAEDMKPVISNALTQAGAVQAYDRMMGQYAKMPFMPDVKANITDHAANKAIDGVFYYVAQEEAAIRANPAKRTTELLRSVFGAQ